MSTTSDKLQRMNQSLTTIYNYMRVSVFPIQVGYDDLNATVTSIENLAISLSNNIINLTDVSLENMMMVMMIVKYEMVVVMMMVVMMMMVVVRSFLEHLNLFFKSKSIPFIHSFNHLQSFIPACIHSFTPALIN